MVFAALDGFWDAFLVYQTQKRRVAQRLDHGAVRLNAESTAVLALVQQVRRGLGHSAA